MLHDNFKLEYSFDLFVHNALSATTDVIPTKAKDALSLDDLEIILSDFPHVYELIRLSNYRKKLGLPEITLIRLLEIHGHISNRERILDRVELTDKEAGSIRGRSVLLFPYICGATEEDPYHYVAG